MHTAMNGEIDLGIDEFEVGYVVGLEQGIEDLKSELEDADRKHAAELIILKQRITLLENTIRELRCEGDWCGKSPIFSIQGIVDDGLCDICKLKERIKNA